MSKYLIKQYIYTQVSLAKEIKRRHSEKMLLSKDGRSMFQNHEEKTMNRPGYTKDFSCPESQPGRPDWDNNLGGDTHLRTGLSDLRIAHPPSTDTTLSPHPAGQTDQNPCST
jgi:hypothetical protein